MKRSLVRISFVVLILGASMFSSSAQKISPADTKKLMLKEDSLAGLAQQLVLDSSTVHRMLADSMFVKVLIRSLQIRNSFFYPFDSLLGVSHLYAPDTSFRIFTWSVKLNDELYSWQRGAIQLRTADGSLKLIPLRDYSDYTPAPMDSIRGRSNWIGAVYYNIIMTEWLGKKYYTLFGHDDDNAMCSKKWIEVLTFTANKEPQFGGPYFTYAKDSIPGPPKYRVSIEYKKGTNVLANFVEDVGIILVDHLVSPTNEPENPWTLVPDGDNEGYKWEKGKWVHVDKPFTLKLQDGQAPVPTPIKNDPEGLPDDKTKPKAGKPKTGNNIP